MAINTRSCLPSLYDPNSKTQACLRCLVPKYDHNIPQQSLCMPNLPRMLTPQGSGTELGSQWLPPILSSVSLVPKFLFPLLFPLSVTSLHFHPVSIFLQYLPSLTIGN